MVVVVVVVVVVVMVSMWVSCLRSSLSMVVVVAVSW